ncbi:Sulfate adenylyltransferase [Entomophthora muscae]|uniref:Sulfate adenylyltransferase n=1 Tax=Entomophthora muscae TaxID=34485 RepID=A0ACC2RXA8_9FUNG|nr:Sulfate adenylyltransferase [Entomophthora muscae]
MRGEFSTDLGYSKKERDLNLQRYAFVSSEIVKAGAAAVCAPIAPYDDARERVRRQVSKYGGFYLVHISTPLQECIASDRSGVYSQAQAGKVKNFTGVDDPFETPQNSQLSIDLSTTSTSQAVHEIVLLLEKDGYFDVPT